MLSTLGNAMTRLSNFLQGESAHDKDDAPALKGTRFQVLQALKCLYAGHQMIVEWKIPDFKLHRDNSLVRNSFFTKLKHVEVWEKAHVSELRTLVLEGIGYEKPIGKILIENSWVKPLPEGRHWIPNLRYYVMTKEGYENMMRGIEWYTSHSFLNRMFLRVSE